MATPKVVVRSTVLPMLSSGYFVFLFVSAVATFASHLPAWSGLVTWPVMIAIVAFGWRLLARRCVVLDHGLVLHTALRTYRIVFDQLKAIHTTPFKSMGRAIAWPYLVVTFIDADGMHLRQVVSVSARTQTALDKAKQVWQALPADIQAQLPEPSCIDVGVSQAPVRGWLRHRQVLREREHIRRGETVTIRGILLGPGIPAHMGNCRIELAATELREHEEVIGGGHIWTVPLADVSDLVVGNPVPPDLYVGVDWVQTVFRTTAGTFTLSCHRDFVALVVEVLTPARPVDSAGASHRATG